jgi:hypothetical protein
VDPLITKLQRRARDPAMATDLSAESGLVAASPLEESSIRRAELTLGLPLPPLLRNAYLRVGNGGFGPGYGLLPLILDDETTGEESAVDLFTAFCSEDAEDPAWSWPRHHLPFCDWGCAIRSCVDCSKPDGSVVTFDPNVRGVGEPMSNALAETHATLSAWFSDWISGVKIWDLMFEPDPSRAVTGTNPFTRDPVTIIPNKLRRL